METNRKSALPAANAKPERLSELSVLRGFAIIGVLSVHATSLATVNMAQSQLYWVYNFLNIFMKFGTTTFIFLSSFVLFYNYYNRPVTREVIRSFYRKRLLYIILPYVLFSLFYFAYQHVHYYAARSWPDTWHALVMQLLQGKAYYHLYFIFINVQFYVLFPFVLLLFQKAKKLAAWAVPIGFAVEWAFVWFNRLHPLQNKGSWSLSYFSYFMLGACIGIYYPKLKGWLSFRISRPHPLQIAGWILLWAVWLAAGLAHVYIWHQARLHGTVYASLLYELLWNVHTIACTLVLFQLSSWLYRTRPLLARSFTSLGSVSFGVYLIHPIVLTIYWNYAPQHGGSTMFHALYAGGFLAALAVSWLIVASATRFLPFAWVLFGQAPRRRTALEPEPGSGLYTGTG
ncbi:acyltransferase [Paenibacillus protaetiae]|uniref:Acyltransferase n=1 Tax=Paenibacillus protaetiae TaxID=2509456 RepID=A0A4P6F585_9BACL|nr:acyltransferase [Paenibacillus protaetiae]